MTPEQEAEIRKRLAAAKSGSAKVLSNLSLLEKVLDEALAPPAFILGETQPTKANTGPRSRPTETITSPLKVTAPATITGKRIEALVSIEAPTTFVDCEIVGPVAHMPTVVRPLVQATNLNASVAFEHCLIAPHVPDPAVSGVMGHRIRSVRSAWLRGVDGIGYNPKGDGSYLTVHGSLIGDLAYFEPDRYQSDGKSHSDCIQVHGDAINIDIVGTTLAGFTDPAVGQGASSPTSTSCVMFSPKGSVMRDVLIDRNWIDGGSASVNFGAWETATNTAVTNNRFGTGQRDGWRIIKKPALAVTITGNTPDDEWKRG